jgi:sterol desaturase/sphingolipid hydroxylase (fatty acid hydroxylase superfamily)
MNSTTYGPTTTIVVILVAMALISALELAIPLHRRTARNRAHVLPNLVLTAITFATSALLNALVVGMLVWLQAKGLGLLNVVTVAPWLALAAVVVVLDLAFYVSHVAMHKVPAFWRVHKVHHSDVVVDVTTTIRQHPFEGLIRYAAIIVAAGALGASPAAFAVYRSALALNALLEHANIRVPRAMDRALSWITTWPNFHKIHHSRAVHECDSNYGNLFSWWDRLFSTFTPAARGAQVETGLAGYDDPSQQTTGALLAMPFAQDERPRVTAPT